MFFRAGFFTRPAFPGQGCYYAHQPEKHASPCDRLHSKTVTTGFHPDCCCVTTDCSAGLSVPWFPHPYNRGSPSNDLTGCRVGQRK